MSMAEIHALSQREYYAGLRNEEVHHAAGFSVLGARKLGPKFPGLDKQMMIVWASARGQLPCLQLSSSLGSLISAPLQNRT